MFYPVDNIKFILQLSKINFRSCEFYTLLITIFPLKFNQRSDFCKLTNVARITILFGSKFDFLVNCWRRNNDFYSAVFWFLCRNISEYDLFVDILQQQFTTLTQKCIASSRFVMTRWPRWYV